MPKSPNDLLAHNCLNFNFRRTESNWSFRIDGKDTWIDIKGSIEADSGEILGELALAGLGIARVATFSVARDIDAGRLLPVLEEFNPGDMEQIHAVFFGGSNMPTRVRVFVDFIASRLR
ncbi:MAG: LysR substrate-binding domain-containing protein, partial [Pseudomonadota bacterium]